MLHVTFHLKATAMTNGAKRVQKHRDKMKAAGLKPVTIWVPDVNAPGFKDEFSRQCAVLKEDPHEQQILAEIEQWSDGEGWK
jgi:antidote-toxin recognition MazE-like antitoxin